MIRGPLWKFLKMLDESWLATADKWDKPRPWNGAWPNHVTVLYHEPGGELRKNVKRWQELANSKDDVEIRGTCVSGCTMIMAYVPKARICFGGNASLWFHRAQVQYENGVLVPDYATTAWMVSQYPPDIRRWIMDKGGPANMTVRDFWELSAGDLWEMGYRKCAPELPPPETYPPPPMEIKSTKTVEFPTYVETEADKQRGKDDEEKWREKDRKAEEFWRQWQADKATQ
jgi:hypothetical protein